MNLQVGITTTRDYLDLASRMREEERRHFVSIAGLQQFDADVFVRALAGQRGVEYCLRDSGRPVIAGGFEPVRTGVYEAWLLGTEDAWTRYWRPVTRICKAQINAMLANAAHRVFTIISPGNKDVARWYVKSLHMRFEGVLRGYCADGSDMALYARTR